MPPPSTDAGGDEAIPELVQLGERLMRAREASDLPLETLAERLHMEPRSLRALEQGAHRQLPEGVFVVAMARRVAHSLNADLDDVISDLRRSRLMVHKPADRATPASGAPTLKVDPPPRSLARSRAGQWSGAPAAATPPRWIWSLAAALATVGVAASGIWFWFKPSQRTAVVRLPSPKSAQPVKSEAGQPAPVGAETSRLPAKAPASATMENDALRLTTAEPSWIHVRDLKGQTVFEGTLTGEKRFPLGRGLEVLAGRPYAVKAAIGTSPPQPLGGVDDIRWSTFKPGAPPTEAPASLAPSP